MHTLPFKGHNVAYQCNGLDQRNIVCDYEVNLSTNEKVVTEKQNLFKNNVKYQGHLKVKVTMLCLWKGHDLSNDMCEYEVNRLTNEKVIRGKRNFNANC